MYGNELDFSVATRLRDKHITDKALESLNGPFTISWDVTNRCNFNCKHCLKRSHDNNYHSTYYELTEDECMILCDQIIEMKPNSMCICGGEPLLRKDLFAILHKLCRAYFN